MTIEEYFSLNEPPFGTSPDPRFLHLSEQVKQAVAKCEYMTTHRRGPLYMYGPIGSGKTNRHVAWHSGPTTDATGEANHVTRGVST